MTKNQKIFAGIDALVETEGLDLNLVIEGLEEAVAIACRKYYEVENVEVNFNYETKRVTINGFKEVQDEEVLGEAFDPLLHFTLEQAQELKAKVKIGENNVLYQKCEGHIGVVTLITRKKWVGGIVV